MIRVLPYDTDDLWGMSPVQRSLSLYWTTNSDIAAMIFCQDGDRCALAVIYVIIKVLLLGFLY